MHDLHFLVPSVLVDPSFAPELLRDQPLPQLGRVAVHAGRSDVVDGAPDAALTRWQSWVFADASGTPPERVNLAELWAMACGIAPSRRAGRYLAEPAHFKVANDHLRLDDPGDLAITLAEAHALVAAIEPVLHDAGWRLDPVEPATLTHWMLHRDDGQALSGAAIERAIGDNVASWQPRRVDDAPGTTSDRDAALAWRRCVNEIQMHWFDHPVNAAREVRGQPTINTLWFSGNGAPAATLPRYAAVDSGLPLLAALPVDPAATCALETFDGFVESARREDWSAWRETLAVFDARIGQILERQRGGDIGTLTLVLCGRDRATALTLVPRDLARFWRRWKKPPSIVALLSEGSP
jgi:hypothetical protein